MTYFLTGATGFVAKGLVEKLLRSAPEVRRIYLLIRPTRHATVEERLEREVFASPAFDRLREIHGTRFPTVMRQKVVAVAGDLTLDHLGLDAERYAELTREVDIVINSAATVVFDEQLDLALEHIAKHKETKTTKAAYENIIWALLNSKAFLFNQ